MRYDHDEEEEEGKEKKSEKEASFRSKIEEKIFNTRTVMIYGGIDMKKAQDVTEKLIALSAVSDDPIKVFINSPGGHVESGDTIYDMIRAVKPRVIVIGTGWVASAGALIFSAPDDVQNRVALPNTRFMLHQPSGGVGGQASDISIEAQEILKMRLRLNEGFARQTGQTLEKIEHDTDRNFWMSAEEAKAYGLVGRIVRSIADI
ncbi:ATP-dependent Clp protease proteolytic subunit ClpP [Verrucomicrobium sp. GAS474]|uniref:ATP-dependent Clp protease proteolytic subunit n=1 Tax=Verrucomicrobium sp. GAS474 TaxID=1882831 RepID=UPI00087987A9|nr:ATP-dependent Clp protease proteolytic subunit [Verrucomicrobium sp. GAS474]SDT90291.1 ATP-dependent Clp protease proteolytic subunit ClpP [Verrucomicrobium sp. GAS474]